MLTQDKQAGFTLVELMVALLVSSMLVGSAIAILSTTVKHNHETINAIRLYQELQGTLELMANDIRRAGYWSNASNDIGSDTNTNPYMAAGTDISINGPNTCILMSYDANDNGILPALNTASDDERYGYRLNGTAVQARPYDAPFVCTAAPGAWEDITDSKSIAITQLQFNNTNTAVDADGTGAGTATINIRNIDITITGHHVDAPNVSKSLTYHVRLRNDKFIP